MTISDAGELNILDEVFNAGAGAFPAGDPYVQLHSGVPGEAGTANIIAHSRVQAAFGAAASGTLSNTGAITFTVMPAITVMGWSIWDIADPNPEDGSPLGVCYWTGMLSVVSGLAVVRSADLAGNDIQTVAHGLAADDRVCVEAVEGLTIPAGLVDTAIYFVLAAGLTTDAYNVSTTSGGAEVDITAAGSAVWRKVTPKPVGASDTFEFAAGELDIFLD